MSLPVPAFFPLASIPLHWIPRLLRLTVVQAILIQAIMEVFQEVAPVTVGNGVKRFTDAALDLSKLCDLIDNENDLDAELIAQFETALDDVTKAVDRRKYFLNEIDSKIALAEAYRDNAIKAIKAFEKLRERVVETTKQVILANPNIPFKDSLGKPLKVIKNPVPSLLIKDNEGWQCSNYARYVEKLELDKARLKEDLIKGKDVDFASLVYGTQLRGL
jgi:hypothetical protein